MNHHDRPRRRRRRWPWILLGSVVAVLLVALAALSFAMVPIPPVAGEPVQFASGRFEHDLWDRVLQRVVDDAGRVDYRTLQEDPLDLEKYYLAVATYSPDSHPEMFPDQDSRLCYWINAYNAAVLKTVLTYYPISSVSEVQPIWYLGFLPENSGFFLLQEPVFGGRPLPLYDLENSVIRKRFGEPRIHFALNCASGGCPRLPRQAFRPKTLQQDLDRESRKFFAEERNLRIDHQARKIYLSALMQWYEADFLSDRPSSFVPELYYLFPFLPAGRSGELELASEAGYAIEFMPYDWRLNDQHAGR
ncbi:MAG: DUF547 domain-containing protein [Planctomycetota bacterium]